jgi:hypothetical protein
MSPKTQTQPSAATADALTATTLVPNAPPFIDPWKKFRSPATNPPGFWTAVKHDAWTGGFVMQMGTVPHSASTPPTSGVLLVGYQWDGYLPEGQQSLIARFQLGPVSKLARGGQVQANVFLQLRGPIGQFFDEAPAVRDGIVYLKINPPVALRAGLHQIRVGAYIANSYAGTADPYAEIINNRTELLYCPPYLQAAGAAQGVQPESAGLQIDEKKLDLQKISLEDTVKSRLEGNLIGEPILAQ